MIYDKKEKMEKDRWKNVYRELPDEPGEYLVEDHAGNRFKSELRINKWGCRVWHGKDRGYDICWWKER